MEDRKRRLLLILAGVAMLPVLAYAGVVAYMLVEPSVDSYDHRLKFDASAWRERSKDDGVNWPTRLRMADDLIAERQLDALPRRKVLLLLGPADETSKFRSWDLIYHLGPERGLFRIDSEWLVLRFNEAGRVSEYKLVRD